MLDCESCTFSLIESMNKNDVEMSITGFHVLVMCVMCAFLLIFFL